MKGTLFFDALAASLLIVLLVAAGAGFVHHRALALVDENARLSLERSALLAAEAIVLACPPRGAARCDGDLRFSHELDARALAELQSLSPNELAQRLGINRPVFLSATEGASACATRWALLDGEPVALRACVA